MDVNRWNTRRISVSSGGKRFERRKLRHSVERGKDYRVYGCRDTPKEHVESSVEVSDFLTISFFVSSTRRKVSYFVCGSLEGEKRKPEGLTL